LKREYERRIGWRILPLLVIAAAPVAVRAEAAGKDARILRSDGSSISFEITVPPARLVHNGDGSVRVKVPGYGTFSPPGAMELPGRTFNVAVPPDAQATISYNITESEVLGSFELWRVRAERFIDMDLEGGIPVSELYLPPDPWNGRVPLETVRAGRPAMMGRQNVLPVMVSPLIASGESYVLARKIMVTIGLGGSGLREEMSEPLTETAPTPAWKSFYDRVLVNPDDTDRFKVPLKERRLLRSHADDGRKLKIRIPESGVYSIRADSLIASGMTPSLSEGQFALRKYYYDNSEPDLVRSVDIPYRIVKGEQSGPQVFEGDDLLVFYSDGVKDDAEAGDTAAVFNTYNILWLVEEAVGAVMQDAPPMPSMAGVDVGSYEHVIREREDTYYQKHVRYGSRDFNFVRGPVQREASVGFETPGVDRTSTFSMHVRINGNEQNAPDQDLDFYVRSGGSTRIIGSGSVSGTESAVFDLTGLPAWYLSEEGNELVVISEEVQYGFLVNDFTVKYTRLFEAHEDMLEFGLEGSLQVKNVEITGFQSGEGYLIDISDPRSPQFLEIPPDSFRLDGSSYTLSLTLAAIEDSRYVALGKGAGGHIYNGWIGVDDESDLKGSIGPYNSLVIAHSDFLSPSTDQLDQYVAWREGQGYRILLADVEDVYDEFNGGLISCDAIRRFIRYGVDNWGIGFVLLIGDSSEDHRRLMIGDPPGSKGSPPDYVPAYTYSVNVVGIDYDEVVASDKYYVFLDEPSPDGVGAEPGTGEPAPEYYPQAAYPDVFLGRIPVGEEIELRAVLTKMLRYEEPAASDTWRRRLSIFADDAHSGRLSAYSYKPVEEHFEQGMDSVIARIEEALPGGFDIERLFLSHWTDAVHPNNEGGYAVYSEAIDSTRRYFTPYMIDKLNRGSLFFSFQGHAARSSLTTEAAFSTFNMYKDLDSLRTDRNFIFIGIGCHISEFALVQELSRTPLDGPNGDCISEQMLFKSRSGAVSTYASTGFEYLLENEAFCTRLHEVIFQRPPDDPIPPAGDHTGARWIMGEVFTAGELEHIGSSSGGYNQCYRYVLLGDPMLRVDPGPPVMSLENDWGEGWEELAVDTLESRNRTNSCRLRFTARDVVALGDVTLHIDGEDLTDSLTVTRLSDEGLTWARGYSADLDYTLEPGEELLVFRIHSTAGEEIGRSEIHVPTVLRLFCGDREIFPGGESPREGEFRLIADFPLYLDQAPVLKFDGLPIDNAFSIPDPQDSTLWEARFTRTLASGSHLATVEVGEYSADFAFSVGGSGLVIDSFNFPNPFSTGTNICYTLNLPADSGRIRIYNVSGLMIEEIVLSRDKLGEANYGSPNAVWWDGRDHAGDPVANGTYIYVLEIVKDGSGLEMTGKAVKLE
jgi:hypothetical protein